MRKINLKTTTYWLTTGLLGLDFLVGGAFQIARSPQAVEGFAHLGYPAYFVSFLGVWKILGRSPCSSPAFRGSRSGPTPAFSSM